MSTLASGERPNSPMQVKQVASHYRPRTAKQTEVFGTWMLSEIFSKAVSLLFYFEVERVMMDVERKGKERGKIEGRGLWDG